MYFSEIINREEVLSLMQIENKGGRFKEKNYQREKREDCNIVATNKYEMIKETDSLPVFPGYQMPPMIDQFVTRSEFHESNMNCKPVIIDRRQNSSQETNEQEPDNYIKLDSLEHKFFSKQLQHNQLIRSSPKVVTSTLFEYSINPNSVPMANKEFVEKNTNDDDYNLEHNNSYTHHDSQTDIMDDTDFFTKLVESLHMEELARLSPHSGYESVTFDKLKPAHDEFDLSNQNFGFIQQEEHWRKDYDMDSFPEKQAEKFKKKEPFAESLKMKICFMEKNDDLKINSYKDRFQQEQRKDYQRQNECTNSKLEPQTSLQKPFENKHVYSKTHAKPPEMRKIILKIHEDMNDIDQRMSPTKKFTSAEKPHQVKVIDTY